MLQKKMGRQCVMQPGANGQNTVWDRSAFARPCAPKHIRTPVAVHTVHVVGTHTPLLMNAKEPPPGTATDMPCGTSAARRARICSRMVAHELRFEAGTWRRPPAVTSLQARSGTCKRPTRAGAFFFRLQQGSEPVDAVNYAVANLPDDTVAL
jgi:hypothetical protein